MSSKKDWGDYVVPGKLVDIEVTYKDGTTVIMQFGLLGSERFCQTVRAMGGQAKILKATT